MKRFVFPRKLRDRTRNAAIVCCLIIIGLFFWSDGETHYISNQRNALFHLRRDQQAEDISTRHEVVWSRCAMFDQRLKNGVEEEEVDYSSSPSIKEFLFPQTTIVAPNIFYCPVSGAASTFLTRYILAIDDLDEKSPFDIPIQIAEKEKMGQLHSLGTDPRQRQFLSQVTKFVFARNPFSRIFSSYIEKLYSPNPDYWHKWGQMAISMSQLDKDFYKCGAFISFRHFVKLVVKELWKSDANLIPMSTLCQLCKIPYDVIGKVEFAMSDIRFLSGKLNVTTKFMAQPKYVIDATRDVIKDVTRDAFGKWNEDIKNCMSLLDMGKIIWRRMQVTGVIDGRFAFPFSETEMATVNRKEFRDLFMVAARKSQDKKRLRAQRYEALVEAYRTVDLSDLEALQGIYARDFYLLGYDYNSSSIFTDWKRQGGRLVYSKILDWRTPWERNVYRRKEKPVKYPL